MAHRKHKGEALRQKCVNKHSFVHLASEDEIYKSNTLCRRGQRHKDEVADFDLNPCVCSFRVSKALTDKSYRVGKYKVFVLSERGKMRRIAAAHYHARVVQRSLHENVMCPVVHKSFIKENAASQKEKGVDFSRNLLKKQLTAFYDKYGAEGIISGGILVGDIHHFFPSLNHEILNALYKRFPLDKETIDLIVMIHKSTEYLYGKVGVPLGNEVSQTDGLLALNPFDHIVKEKWHIPFYGRYMDDFYLIHPDMEYLKSLLEKIDTFLTSYKLTLNHKKTKVVPIWQGFSYLGFSFRMDFNGKVYARVKPSNLTRNKTKMKKMDNLYKEGKIEFRSIYDSFVCQIGHLEKGNTFYLRENRRKLFCEKYEKEIIQGINDGWIKERTRKGNPCKILPERNFAVKRRIMKAFEEKTKANKKIVKNLTKGQDLVVFESLSPF